MACSAGYSQGVTLKHSRPIFITLREWRTCRNAFWALGQEDNENNGMVAQSIHEAERSYELCWKVKGGLRSLRNAFSLAPHWELHLSTLFLYKLQVLSLAHSKLLQAFASSKAAADVLSDLQIHKGLFTLESCHASRSWSFVEPFTQGKVYITNCSCIWWCILHKRFCAKKSLHTATSYTSNLHSRKFSKANSRTGEYGRVWAYLVYLMFI